MPQNELKNYVAALNVQYRHHSATSVLAHAFSDSRIGKVALVSSFGAESVVLLHMISVSQPDTTVLFLDTQMLFTETLVYQHELSERLGLRDLRIIQAQEIDLSIQDPKNTLYKTNPGACCNLRKAIPLQKALSGFDGWITGRKRYQGGQRTTLDFYEIEAGTNRIKINPLAHWTPDDVRTYIEENRLPKHPMVAQGYPSIGCIPCTSPVAAGEDPRTGRWRGQDKTECGIHFVDGKLIRTGAPA